MAGEIVDVSVKRATGRPSLFAQEIADLVVERVSLGEPLAAVCRDIGLGLTTWYQWVKDRPALSEAIASAREAGFDMIAAEALRIADTTQDGETTETKEWGTATKREDMLGHRKLQVDTRLKLLAKWDPKRYGERVAAEIHHTGLGDILQAIDGSALRVAPQAPAGDDGDD